MNLCKEGQRLSYKHRDICVRANGDCTPLYYHIQECDKCEELRNDRESWEPGKDEKKH